MTHLVPTRFAALGVLLFAITVFAAGRLVVASAAFDGNPSLLAWAVSIDIAVLVPAAYLLCALRFGWPRLTTVPIFVVSLITAGAILPAEHRGALPVLDAIAIPIELGLLGYVVWKTRRELRAMRAGGDAYEDFVELAADRLSAATSRVRAIVLTELLMFYYGLTALRRGSPREGGFSYHRKSGLAGVAGAFSFLLVVETIVLHMIVHARVPWLAWVLTASSVYGLLFLVAEFHGIRSRPIRVDDGVLRLRSGLRWRAEIPVDQILSMESSGSAKIDGEIDLTLIGSGSHRIRTEQPIELTGLYGMTRRATSIRLSPDEPAALREALDLPDSN